MTTYLISDRDIACLNTYGVFITQLPDQIDLLKKQLPLTNPQDFDRHAQPALDSMATKIKTDSTLWVPHQKPWLELHRELCDFLEDLTVFAYGVSAHVTQLDRQKKRASITHVDHSHVLLDLARPLKPSRFDNPMDIHEHCWRTLLLLWHRFSVQGVITAKIHTSAATLKPRLMDFLNRRLFAHAGSPPKAATGTFSIWMMKTRQARANAARDTLPTTQRDYEHTVSAASNVGVHFNRTTELLQTALVELHGIDNTTSLLAFDNALKLILINLNTVHDMTRSMSRLLRNIA